MGQAATRCAGWGYIHCSVAAAAAGDIIIRARMLNHAAIAHGWGFHRVNVLHVYKLCMQKGFHILGCRAVTWHKVG